jgi:hypothetical protein
MLSKIFGGSKSIFLLSMIKKIPLHIYPFDIIVFLGSSDSQVESFLSLYFSKKEVSEYEHFWKLKSPTNMGRTVLMPGNKIMIRTKAKCPTLGVVAHEVFHAVEFLFEIIGIKHCDESSEAWAYMIEYLTNEIYKLIKK